jgi:carbon monoxide dehydrogenase subunit G
MKLNGSVTINAPRQIVWQFITDPEAVARCAPGVESMQIVEPDKSFKVVASVGFGTVKVKFNTDVEMLDRQPPSTVKIKARGIGSGNAADVLADIMLTDGPNRTTDLAWTADATISGNIASVAMRLMGSVTQSLSGKFFECMKAQVEVAEGVVEATAPAQPSGVIGRIKDWLARFFRWLASLGRSTSK